ncbi:MAG: UbiH/UbiF/VisC/COQ6 family ubiquinone biosynthesis hydroxylase [Alphaproteobacteria bacterium]|nr:UbiH/UbiF/VisC/COQ6 family ubiquinone biosynthesis hydroxylase [Alphaproteobacteria bacterium]
MSGEARHEGEVGADVVIGGGGMVGLSLGCALAGAGFEVVVVDREDPAVSARSAFDGRASALAHASQQALAALGLWRDMAPEAQPILEIRVSDGDSLLFLHYDHRELGAAPLGYMVENRITRRALHRAVERTPGLTLKAPGTIERLEPGGAGISARLSDGSGVRATLAVAADGRNSGLRQGAGIRVTEWRYAQTGIVCTVAHELSHRGVAQERFLPSGPFAILPLKHNRSSLVWTERAELAPALLALGEAPFADEMRRRFGDFLGATRVVGGRWSYPLALLNAERYVAPRLALVGDAAHAMHPLAGQGLNLGLRDVAALAEVLTDARRLGLDIGSAAVLERYQRWRRFDSMVLLALTDSLNRLFSNDIAALRIARDLGLAAVHRLPPLKRLIMRHAMGTVGKLPRLLAGEAL